ncbi:hypothetical protein ACLEPN_40190, partial [Myxococcus sp. 1LA]
MALFEQKQKLMRARSWTLPALLLAWASPAAAQSELPQDAAAMVPEPSQAQDAAAPEPAQAQDAAGSE